MDKTFIASRIREERERCDLRQEDVAKYMGWDSSKHSIVVEIESGRREVKAWELYKLAQLFHIEVDEFFKSASCEESLILWRQRPDETALKERQFLQRCQDYKNLEDALGERLPVSRPLAKYRLNIESASKKWAGEIADCIRKELNLGDFPANLLAKTLEEHYGVRFLALPLGRDDTDGAAACTVYDFGPAILLNSEDGPARQTFSIAHELFHIITWDLDLFDKLLPGSKQYKKNELLANTFAAGLLLPEDALRQQIRRLNENGPLQYPTIIAIAREYGVSVQTLLYRLEALELISQKHVDQSLADPFFQSLNKESSSKACNYSSHVGDRFIRIAYLAYQFGKISRSRLARLLNSSLASLEQCLADYGLTEIADEEIQFNHS